MDGSILEQAVAAIGVKLADNRLIRSSEGSTCRFGVDESSLPSITPSGSKIHAH